MSDYVGDLTHTALFKPQYKEWYHVNDFDSDEEKVALGKRFHTCVQGLEDDQASRIAQLRKYGSLYQNSDLLNQMSPYTPDAMPGAMVLNMIGTIVDSLVAKQVVNASKATFDVDDGDWEAHQKADMLDKFAFGEFYRCKVYELHEQAFRDAAWAGDGWIHYRPRTGEVYASRVFPLEMRIDPRNCVSDSPRELYRIRYVSKSVAAATYPDFAQRIWAMKPAAPPYPYPGASDDTLIRLCEGWHLPSGPDGDASVPGNRGAYMFACNDCVLHLEEWRRERFPFVRMSYSKDVAGGYSLGIVQALAPLQLELDKLKRRKLQGLHLYAIPRLMMQAGSKVSPDYNTQVGQIYTWSGSKPETELSKCVAPEIIQEEQNIISQMWQIAGLSPLDRGSMPSRVDSQPGLREYIAAADEKHALPSLTWNRSFLDAATQIIDCARDIVREHGSYRAFGAAKDFVVTIHFEKCDLEDERFRIKLQNTNLLPTTPAGRRLTIMELMKTPFFASNPQMLFQAVADDHPDVQAMLGEATLGKRLVEKQLYMITVEGKYFAPDSHQDVTYAKQRAQDAVQMMLIRSNGGYDASGKVVGNVNEIIAKLDKYIAACTDIEQKAMQAQMAQQQAAMAQQGAPPNGGAASPVPGPGGPVPGASPAGPAAGAIGPAGGGPIPGAV